MSDVTHFLEAVPQGDLTAAAGADVIFTQAENRLHVQKAILQWLGS